MSFIDAITPFNDKGENTFFRKNIEGEEKGQVLGKLGDLVNPFNDRGEKAIRQAAREERREERQAAREDRKAEKGMRPGALYSADLAERWMQAQANPMSLGYSNAEMQAGTAAAAQNAQAAQNAEAMRLNQTALAAEPFKAGAIAEGARGLADGAEDAAAKASADLWARNQALINQRMEMLRQEMLGLRNLRRTDQMEGLEYVLAAAQTAGQISSVTGEQPSGSA